MNGSGLFAQAVDNTGRDVTLIIVGLLVVAGLLGALTVWYWRYTDPRKRVRAQSPEALLDVEPAEPQHAPRAASAPVAPRPASARRTEREAVTDSELLQSDDGADEWLRLTGPRGKAIR